jgi:hypothetical protein
VGFTVPVLVGGGVFEAKVGGEVDDAGGELGPAFDLCRGFAVGEAEEEEVALGDIGGEAEGQFADVGGDAAEMGVDHAEWFTCAAA